jgi:hypothetical protein
MGITPGTVIAGKVVVEGMELPEVWTVTVLTLGWPSSRIDVCRNSPLLGFASSFVPWSMS